MLFYDPFIEINGSGRGQIYKYCIVASCCTLQFIIITITTVLSATIPQPKSLNHF
jgi:hypothetical protein